MAHFYPHSLHRHAQLGAELISLAEAKLYLRIDHNEEDSLISGFIKASREYAEDMIKASLVQQQWKLSYQCEFPNNIHLPMGPVELINSVELEDNNGTITLVNSNSYSLNKTDHKLTFNMSIYGASLSIIYQSGAHNEVEEALRQAMLAHTHALYEGRGAATVPALCRDTYHHYRKVSL